MGSNKLKIGMFLQFLTNLKILSCRESMPSAKDHSLGVDCADSVSATARGMTLSLYLVGSGLVGTSLN